MNRVRHKGLAAPGGFGSLPRLRTLSRHGKATPNCCRVSISRADPTSAPTVNASLPTCLPRASRRERAGGRSAEDGVQSLSATHSVLSQIARPYASALFDLAVEGNAVDAVEAGLDTIGGLLADSEDFTRFTRSPTIYIEEKARVLDTLLAKAGLPDILANTLRILARNGRLFALPALIEAYKALAAAHRNEVRADVVSAAPLSDSQRSALSAVLAEKIGKRISLRERVDESLIGGLIVQVGSKMIDSSLKTKLSAMKIAMKGVS